MRSFSLGQRILFCTFMGAVLSACTPSSSPEITNTISPESSSGIIGGAEVGPLDIISQSVVAVYDATEGQLCSGTLINSNVVLTAAHCVGSVTENMYVFFGSNLDTDGVYVQVDKLEVSPYWTPGTSNNKDLGDIALLHFIGKLPASYKPAQMLPKDLGTSLVENTKVVIAGYGVTDATKDEGAKILRRAEVTIDDPALTKSEVLVNQSKGQSVCHGDSGGPAFIQIEGKSYLWGVTSRGIGNKQNACDQYAVFSSTLYHRAWINRMNIKLSTNLIDLNGRGF